MRGSKYRLAVSRAMEYVEVVFDEGPDFDELETTGICTECLAETTIEPDQDAGVCPECHQNTVVGIPRLLGVI